MIPPPCFLVCKLPGAEGHSHHTQITGQLLIYIKSLDNMFWFEASRAGSMAVSWHYAATESGIPTLFSNVELSVLSR